MSDILDEILEAKRAFLEREKDRVDRNQLREAANAAEPGGFREALETDGLQLISEIKPKAPSAGRLTDLPPEAIARIYQEECPAAVSVLTDEPYFGMTLEDFRTVRKVLRKPILRKEFVIDPFQVTRSAALGADAILLIASVLEPDTTRQLRDLASEYGLQCLVEIHSREEWESLPFTPEILGINNRTLDGDFSTDLAVTEDLAPAIPDEVTIVSESGISTHEDILRLEKVSGVEAVLVGTSLVESAESADRIRDRIRQLMNVDK